MNVVNVLYIDYTRQKRQGLQEMSEDISNLHRDFGYFQKMGMREFPSVLLISASK